MRKSTLAAGLGILALAAGFTVPAQAHRTHEPRVVADGLVGPLTLAVADRGSVLVTQSFAGLLSRVDKRGGVTDLHQIEYPPEASELIGVAYDRGATFHIETDYSGEAPTSHVIRTSRDGTRTVVSDDLWAYEIANNPDASQTYGFIGLDAQCAAEVAEVEATLGFAPFSEYQGIVESHAYQLDVHRGHIYVADAAANAVLRVDQRSGDISTVAVLPPVTSTITAEALTVIEDGLLGGMQLPDCVVGNDFTSEPVPTDVQRSDGKLYVSTLGGGVGEYLPQSSVYQIDPRNGRMHEIVAGLHGATGLDTLPRGHIVVAEMFGSEVSLIHHHRRGTRVEQLFATDEPAADVAVRGSTVYATTIDLEAGGTGSLLKYQLRGRDW